MNKYLFIEVKTIENGTVISGKPQRVFIDGPPYGIDGSNLHLVLHPELNSSVRAIYGSYFQLKGDAGSGIGSSIHPIGYLPYTYGNISVLEIREDNVTLSYDNNNNNIILLPGESWKNENQEMERTDSGLLNITTTIFIYNHGRVKLNYR